MSLEGPHPVVLMLTSFDVGGTERQTVELVRRLDPHRFHVHVACFHARGPLRDAVPPSVPVEAFPVKGFRRGASIGQWMRFVRWCRAIGARVVHTCDLYANVFGLPGAAFAGVPVRIGSRREVITGDKTALQLAGQRYAYRTAHMVVANSTAAADQLAREGVAAGKVRLIRNGVDVEAFETAGHRARARIAMVANLRAEKGHDVLIDAAPQILGACPEATFVLAGSGPMAEALARRAADRGVRDRVEFVGHCDDVPALLSSCDLFVLPSRSEALPNAVIEAMAAGLPVAASDVGGIPELITHNETGVLVPPGDAAALARSVIDLLERPAFAGALGRAARARVARQFGFGRLVAEVESLYQTAIEDAAPLPVTQAGRA
ncbi:MAG: glycosyltransferase [Vicinamibacterales bacterium]